MAQQSWEVPLCRLMVTNQIEQQAVSWQTLRSMSVSPPASFPATPYFTSQNYFYFHLSEVLVLWAQGWFWCVQLPEASSTILNSHTHTQLLKLPFRLASSKLGFEECKFLMSYQSRKLAVSEATSAAFQPSSLKTCGCKGEERFRRTMVTASTKGKGQPRCCLWSGHGAVAGKLRGQLDLYPTGRWGLHH